ncbi:MAG: undecaprenyl-diphosphatase [Thermoleophilaceae bacterium]|jgi:undecaprenyl-diphosphatase|nr:undecaprenyl-diphosphatase [Thermoleophilaceae bacterium]
MSIFEAIVLGIVQGLTEFLPVSSTAHLRIVPAFAGWEDPGAAFTAVIQLGTTIAVLLYFRRDLWRIALAWLDSVRTRGQRRDLDARLGWFIVLGTIPIGIFGLLFNNAIETKARDLYLIGTALIVFGFVMLAADRFAKQSKDLEALSTREGLFVGLAQALALIPGVSRSGATISAGLLAGLNREAAARFSFLLSTPAIVLSAAFEMRKFIGHDAGAGAPEIVVAVICAFVVGYASIAFLLRYVARHTLSVFVAYRVGLGALVIALTAAGTIS